MSIREKMCLLGETAVARALRSSANLRQWTARSFECNHFEDLKLSVDLGHGLNCPILDREAWSSFTEIFVHRPMHRLFEFVPLPDTWVDLGCHFGFFSLWVEQARRQAGRIPASGLALLADADARAVLAAKRMMALNALTPGVDILHRAVGEGSSVTIYERHGMGSSLFDYPRLGGRPNAVPTLSENDFKSKLSGDIDLLKVDVEGAELILFRRYSSLLKRVRFMVLEWHSWACEGGDGKLQAREAWELQGFRHLATLEEPRHLLIDGRSFECGTEALVRG